MSKRKYISPSDHFELKYPTNYEAGVRNFVRNVRSRVAPYVRAYNNFAAYSNGAIPIRTRKRVRGPMGSSVRLSGKSGRRFKRSFRAGRRRFGRRRRGMSRRQLKFGFKATGGPNVFTGVLSGRISVAAQGQQVMQGGSTDWKYLSITNPCILLPVVELIDIWDGLPVQNISSSTINATPGAGTYQNPDRFWISEALTKCSISNPNNYPVNVQAYYFKPRRDVPNQSGYASINTILDASFTSQTVGSVTSTGLSSTPFMAHVFCQMFKCYKVKKTMYGPGEQGTYTLSRKRPLFVDVNRFLTKSAATGAITYNQAYYALRECTKFIVFRIWGGVANDATTKTSVSVDPASIDFITNIRVVAHPVIQSVSTNLIIAESQLTTGKLASGLTLETVGTETDAVVTDASF